LFRQLIKAFTLLISILSCAYGEVLFTDDFNDGDDDGWLRSGSASWQVISGEYHMYTEGKGQGTSFNSDQPGVMSTADYSILATINIEAGTNAGIIARFNGPGNWYYRLILYTAGGGNLKLDRKQDGGPTFLLDEYPLAVNFDTDYMVRLQVSGDMITGRAWTGTLEDEPDVWQVSDQDNLQGEPGSFALTSGGYGKVSWSCKFDDVVVSSPVPMVFTPATWASIKYSYLD